MNTEATPRPQDSTPAPSRWTRLDVILVALLSAIPLAVHVAATMTAGYSYFIDEFYYLACARRLAFGYVDHPPLAPFLLALTRPILGESTLGIRILPFLAASATVWATAAVVRRLGGGRFATILASLALGLMPVLLAMTGFFSMNAFEPLLWTLTLLVLLRLVQTGDSRLWLLVGLLIGLGFENKHTIAAFVLALGAGIVATRARRMLLDRWLWLGAAVAIAVALPNVVWQAMNGWPSIEFYRNAQTMKNVHTPPVRSILSMIVTLNPLTLPVWLAGFAWLLAGRDTRALRFLAVAALVVVLEYVASGSSRADRPMAAFPFLLAAGSVVIERWVRGSVARTAIASIPALTSLALVPVVSPVLTPPVLARYVAAIGFNMQIERGKTSPLPQLLADRTGWESFIDDVARVYQGLPQEDQRRAVIFVPDYGHAGAIELWGPSRGLPRVISPHNTYWHWSEGHVDTPVLIAVRANPEDLRRLYRDVKEAGLVSCDYCMSWRSHMPIYVARDPIQPVENLWARARHYE